MSAAPVYKNSFDDNSDTRTVTVDFVYLWDTDVNFNIICLPHISVSRRRSTQCIVRQIGNYYDPEERLFTDLNQRAEGLVMGQGYLQLLSAVNMEVRESCV